MSTLNQAVCPHCNAHGQPGLFCQSCGLYAPDHTGTLERVTYNRRFFGDNVLEGLLFLLTLGIGWFIWLSFTAGTSQTPAKRILNVYIIDTDSGQPIKAGRVWVREVLVKLILVTALNFVVLIASFVDSIWVFFDKDRQTLHDKVVNTVVVYAPQGLPEEMNPPTSLARPAQKQSVKDVAQELRGLADLHKEGILTDEEYENKRRELADKL